MKILGIEFSTKRRSVAVLNTDANGNEISRGSAVQKLERSTKAFALIELALKDANVQREEVEFIAVGVGPGSLTGIRMAISIAQGWQLARSVKTVGISSFDCLAHQLQYRKTFGCVSVLIDTRRKEFSRKDFEISAEAIIEHRSPFSATADEITALAAGGAVIVGTGIGKIVPSGIEIFPDAMALCELAVKAEGFVDATALEPIVHNPVTFVKAAGK